MNRMDFYSVDTGFFQQYCGLGKRIHKLLNLFFCHFPGRNLITPAVRGWRCRSRNLVQIHKRLCDRTDHRIGIDIFHHLGNRETPAKSCRQLYKQFGSGRMEFRHPAGQIAVHLLIFVQPLTAHRIVYRLAARKHQTCIVLGDIVDKLCTGFIEMVFFHPSEQIGAAHGSQYDTVFNFTVPNLPGGK